MGVSRRWSEWLAPYAGVKLVAYHNSWPYFARRFRLDVVDFIEPKPGVAPSPAHLARLISAGRKAQVRAIVLMAVRSGRGMAEFRHIRDLLDDFLKSVGQEEGAERRGMRRVVRCRG